jgi:hypothetical protein
LFEVPPHAPTGALQTAPGRRHCADSQRPSVSPEPVTQRSGSFGWPFDVIPGGRPGPPQQSDAFAHSSSCGLHPEGGWQMLTPVAPSGPHESEQHLLSQPAPVQSDPAGAQGAFPTTAHRPSAAPGLFTQSPPQHSPSFAQTSFTCVQNDALLQCLVASHWPEQQSAPFAHGLPSVRHDPPASAVHLCVPATSHLPLQHSAFVVQASATGESALHCFAEQ